MLLELKRIIHIFFILVLIVHSQKSFSQFNKIWYFGSNAGLDFNTPIPTILTNGQANNFDNTSTITDASGNLLFYTDGMSVWNKNHIVMPNGFGLIGNTTAGQCCLIVPIPCSNKKYVIFHNTHYSNPGNLSYSVVDMNLNGGLGDVVVGQKNISLGIGWTEKICAYYNSTGNNYWVLTQKWLTNQYVAFKVDATTIATTSVTTNIGSILNCGTFGGTHDAMGQLTISPDGTKVLNALTCVDQFEIFNFNSVTGVLSNSILIPGNTGNAWGTAFSPDSKKIYVNSIFGKSVYQYDVSTFTGPAIIASQSTLYVMPNNGYNFGYMELGPDNKIYITRPNTNWLSVVNNPNLLGTACNFSLTGQSTGIKQSLWGLSRIAYNIPVAAFGGTLNLTSTTQSVSCNGLTNGSGTITVSTPGIYTYTWSPGNYTTSVVNNLGAGNYTVTVSDGGCNTNTAAVTITQPSAINLSISSPTAICKNSNTILSSTVSGGNPAYSYIWLPGGNNSSTLNANVSSTYTLSVQDASGCSKTATTSVSLYTVTSNFSYNLNPCNGSLTTTNTSIGASSYNWNFGDGFTSASTSPSHIYASAGNYIISLICTNPQGCSDTINKNITISSVSQSVFTNTISLCDSIVGLTNNSVGANSYLWNFGDGSTSILANPSNHTYTSSGNYTITLITNPGSSCADTSKQVISVIKNTQSQFNVTSSACSKLITTTNSSSLATSYLWQFGDGSTSTATNPNYNYSATGIYTITLFTNPGSNCADTSFKVVTITNPPVASFNYTASLCSGLVTFSNTSLNSSSFLWDFGNGQSSSLTNPMYTYNGQGTYTISLIAFPGSPCADTVTKIITIKYTTVIADFNYQNPEFTYDILFNNLSVNASLYVWDFGDGSNSGIENPNHTYNFAGDYTVCLEASNSLGCKDLICKKISVKPDWTLYVPNTFTPNEDGLNDIFYTYGSNIISFKIMIFDRWGEQIFYSDDMRKGWDGKYNGQLVKEDTYTWKIIAIDYNRKSHDLTGHVNVIR